MSRQKRKGDGYEREIAKFLDEVIYGGVGNIQRAMLSGGGRNISGGGMPDITGPRQVQTIRSHGTSRGWDTKYKIKRHASRNATTKPNGNRRIPVRHAFA